MAGKLIALPFLPSFNIQARSINEKNSTSQFFFFHRKLEPTNGGLHDICIVGKQLGGKRWEDMGRAMQWGAGMVGHYRQWRWVGRAVQWEVGIRYLL
jgi:hypothetical protein